MMKWQRLTVFSAMILAACDQAPGQMASGSTMSALDVCKRDDVQEAVGKEVRGMMFKNVLPSLSAAASMGLVDVDRFAQSMEDAEVTFSRVALRKGGAQDGASIGCSGGIKIDASSATAGQDVVQIRKLVWHVSFAEGDSDFASSNFTVEVDPDSLASGMAINGQPVERVLAAEEARKQDIDELANQALAAPSPSTQASDGATTAAGSGPTEADQAAPQPPSEEPLNVPRTQ